MPILWKENQPSTTSNRFIIVANTGRRMQIAARPAPEVLAFIGRLNADGKLAAPVAMAHCFGGMTHFPLPRGEGLRVRGNGTQYLQRVSNFQRSSPSPRPSPLGRGRNTWPRFGLPGYVGARLCRRPAAAMLKVRMQQIL